MLTNYDAVVIGAGSGGLTSAVGLAKAGKKVLLVEREHMGGECTNSGCIPSKALLHHAKAYRAAISIAGTTTQSETFRSEAFSYVRSKIEEVLAEETAEHFAKLGITVIEGDARFVDKCKVAIGKDTYRFKKAVIATGSIPKKLPVPGLPDTEVITNQNLFSLPVAPRSILIIGAGPIGMEMGQALALLGSQVTIVDNGPRFARLEDELISSIITETFTDLGIKLVQNATVKLIENGQAKIVSTSASEDDVSHTLQVPCERVLLAIGRTPNLPDGLINADVNFTEFGITVDESWRTSNPNIYAIGDVSAKLKFTHVADHSARQVVAHIVSKGLLTPKEKLVPKVTYTEPEIAQVGLSWTEAKDTLGEASLLRIEVPFSANDRARTDNDTNGVLIIIAKRLTGKIVGAHLIGPRAGELIGTLTLAMENNLSLYRLRSTIFAYPTYSLILKKAGDYFLAAQIASLRSDLWQALKSLLPKLFILLLWCLALLSLHEYQIAQDLTVSEIALLVFTFATSTVWGPFVYIAAYAVRPLTFLPGTLLTVLSGVFFGLWGILYTIVGANLSASLAYGVGRFFSQDGKGSKSLLAKWSDRISRRPFMTILTMRLTFFPFDVVNYGAGFLRIPFLPYLLATIIGTLLGIATFVSIGASLSVEEFLAEGITAGAINTSFIILSVVIFIASLAIAKALRQK